jgi:RNA polymerase sigma-70 factor (ECF subfamily)
VTADRAPALDLDQPLPRIAAGDQAAFAEWMRGAEPRIRDSLRSFAATVDVEAAVQETLLRVWQVAPRFVPDGRENGLLRLAIRIGRNFAVSELRRRHVEPMEVERLEREAQVNDQSGAGPARPSDPLLRRRIEECLRRLPRQPGRALASRLESGGLQPDELLAEEIGMRRNTFLQNITRARNLVAECLERHGIDLATELV